MRHGTPMTHVSPAAINDLAEQTFKEGAAKISNLVLAIQLCRSVDR